MSETTLRASLELTFRDELTAPLQLLRDLLSELRDLTASLRLTGLQDAGATLRGVATDLDPLKSGLDQVTKDAAGAAGAVASIKAAADELRTVQIVPIGTMQGEYRAPEFDPRFDPARGARGEPRARSGSGDGAMDGLIAGGAVLEPSHLYAEFDKILRQIAITSGLSGAAVAQDIARHGAIFAADALRFGLTSMSVAEAYLDLESQGIKPALLDKIIGLHSEAAAAYNILPEALGAPVGALLGQMGIDESTMAGTLAAMALASKSGRFKMPDFATELANVSGQASLIGITGRGGADEVFALLETVMRNVGQAGSASADLTDLIGYIFSPREDKRAAKMLGVDLPKYLASAAEQGVNPLDAFVELMEKRTKGMTGEQIEAYLTPLIMNQQARTALIALIEHADYFDGLRAKLDAVQPDQLAIDAKTALAGPQTTLNRGEEAAVQAGRATGGAFMPIIAGGTAVLEDFNTALTAISNNPFGKFLLTVAGGLLTLLAGLSALKFGFGLLSGGIELLHLGTIAGWLAGMAGDALWAAASFAFLNPVALAVGLAIAGIGAAAYLLMGHWKQIVPFWRDLWTEIEAIFRGAERWFDDSALGHLLGLQALPQLAALSSYGGAAGMAGAAGTPAGAAVHGTITVHVSGPAAVAATSHTPGVTLHVASTGNTTRRP